MDLIASLGNQTLVHRLVLLFRQRGELAFFPDGFADEVGALGGWVGSRGGRLRG
jgi:hypothetical protein